MRILAGLLFMITSCTHAPSREPAQVCMAFGKPLDMNEIRTSALESLEQYQGIRSYMNESFFPRISRDNSCGLREDINYSLNYFKQKLEDSQRLGMRVLDMRVIESVSCMKPLVQELRPGFEQLKKDLEATAQALSEWQRNFKTPSDCGERKEWTGLKSAMSSLLQSSGPVSGSAFVTEAGGKKYLVTAAHVSNLSLKPAPFPSERKLPSATELPLITKNADGNIEQELMAIYPGEIDFSLDISFKPTARPSRAFKTAATQELVSLRAGRLFYALGFPITLKGRVDAIPCVFEGFAPGQRKSREAQLLLYCPGRGNSVGISGGPLVDEGGRVWGMISSQAAYSGALLATPVLEMDGKLQQGVGITFQSDLCYNRNLTYRGPCTVMPNMFETQIP